MLDHLRLADIGPARRLALDIAPRLNALTGDNGLGKSFVLDVVWWVLTGSWSGTVAAPFIQPGDASNLAPSIEWTLAGRGAPLVGTYDWRAGRWRRPENEPPIPGVVIYARVDGSLSIRDPLRNDWQPSSAEAGRPARPTGYHFTKDDVWRGLRVDGQDDPLSEGLLRDWVCWQLKSKVGEVDGLDPFALLTAALEKLSPTPDEVLRPGPSIRPPGAARDEPSLAFGYGVVPVRHASAGVRRIVSLAYLIVWTWYEHRIAARGLQAASVDRITLLIDEAESHLHPQWQRRLMPALMRVLADLAPEMNVQVMLTTHSPLVLASFEPDFDPDQDRLFLFEQARSTVTLRQMPWSPNGGAE